MEQTGNFALSAVLNGTGFGEEVKQIIRNAKPIFEALSPEMKEKLHEIFKSGGVLL